MRQRVIGKERTVDALATLCRDYRSTAEQAIKTGDSHVYIPMDTSAPQDVLFLLAHPEQILEAECSNENGEPCYSSFSDFLKGTNENSTVHSGYLRIDPIANVVVGLGNRDGDIKSAVSNPFDEELMGGFTAGKTYSNCLTEEDQVQI
jgi:hypothetical protein